METCLTTANRLDPGIATTREVCFECNFHFQKEAQDYKIRNVSDL